MSEYSPGEGTLTSVKLPSADTSTLATRAGTVGSASPTRISETFAPIGLSVAITLPDTVPGSPPNAISSRGGTGAPSVTLTSAPSVKTRPPGYHSSPKPAPENLIR